MLFCFCRKAEGICLLSILSECANSQSCSEVISNSTYIRSNNQYVIFRNSYQAESTNQKLLRNKQTKHQEILQIFMRKNGKDRKNSLINIISILREKNGEVF